MSRARLDPVAFRLQDVQISYGENIALSEVSMSILEGAITTFIGPSGCGKTSLLRSLNRLTDLTAGIRVEGSIRYRGEDVHSPTTVPEELRRRIGMVFQKPNVFPRSIYDNVAYGPRLHGTTSDLDSLVESCLIRAGLWADVRSQLSKPAHELSGGQQQRLVIARALAVQSEVLLMDEPSASLDPAAAMAIEQLMLELAQDHTIVLVTHNLRQAMRVSDFVAFFDFGHEGLQRRHGHLVEFGDADQMFNRPQDGRTRNYLAG